MFFPLLKGEGLLMCDRLEETKKSIEAEIPEAKIRLLVLDLASLASVREAAAEVTAYSEPIDVRVPSPGLRDHTNALPGPHQQRSPPSPLLLAPELTPH